RGEVDVVTAHEIVDHQYPVEVVSHVECGAALFLVAGPEPALNRTADALERARGDDPFGSTADSEQHVGSRVAPRNRDRTRDVAVGDEANSCAGLAALP